MPGRAVGDAGGREHRVHVAVDLLERGVDRGTVAEVDLDRLRDVELDRREVHHHDLGAERADGLRRGRAHAGRATDDEHALAVVAEPVDVGHCFLLLVGPGRRRVVPIG